MLISFVCMVESVLMYEKIEEIHLRKEQVAKINTSNELNA